MSRRLRVENLTLSLAANSVRKSTGQGTYQSIVGTTYLDLGRYVSRAGAMESWIQDYGKFDVQYY